MKKKKENEIELYCKNCGHIQEPDTEKSNSMRKVKKAKEYADYILSHADNEEEFLKAMSKVVTDMVLEIQILIKARNIQTQSALKAIILEQDKKWKAVCNRAELEGMKDVFMKYLKKECLVLLKAANM